MNVLHSFWWYIQYYICESEKKNVLHSIEAYKAMIKAEVLLEVIRIRVFRMHCEVRWGEVLLCFLGSEGKECKYNSFGCLSQTLLIELLACEKGPSCFRSSKCFYFFHYSFSWILNHRWLTRTSYQFITMHMQMHRELDKSKDSSLVYLT